MNVVDLNSRRPSRRIDAARLRQALDALSHRPAPADRSGMTVREATEDEARLQREHALAMWRAAERLPSFRGWAANADSNSRYLEIMARRL